VASDELIVLVNRAVGRELAAVLQYLWQSVMAEGMESPGIRRRLREIALAEMAHAEEIARRLHLIGGVPTTRPWATVVGGSLNEMIGADLDAETAVIELFREIIQAAAVEGDPATRLLFERLLADEESHQGEFEALLGRRALAAEEGEKA